MDASSKFQWGDLQGAIHKENFHKCQSKTDRNGLVKLEIRKLPGVLEKLFTFKGGPFLFFK